MRNPSHCIRTCRYISCCRSSWLHEGEIGVIPHPRQELFDRCVLPHLQRLFRVAYRLTGDAANAQDLVQDTCVTACEHLDALAVIDAPQAWLLRVMHNRFIDGSRRQTRGPFVALADGQDPGSLPCTTLGPEESALQDDAMQTLLQMFQALEPTQRVLLGLRAEGYGLAEIESITGVGRDVLRARLHRARRSLARLLDARAEQDIAATGARRSGNCP